MFGNITPAAVLWLGLSRGVSCLSHSHKHAQCRYIPGDEGFPGKTAWNQLNATVNGRLIGTVPAAIVCHGDNYDEQLCNNLKQEWDLPQPQSVPSRPLNTFKAIMTDCRSSIYESAEIMSPYWQNQSCDPFTARATPCHLGNYVSYSINVTEANDVRTGIDFAKQHNIRLVIKNTGHDYLGRSTGKGALGLWMQNLKSITVFQDYKSPHYSGPAMKLGAGVLSADAYIEAHKYGLRVVGGGCPSVGIAGGYTQGGGHSLLTSTHGLSADNVLEWEVVTADGEHIIATPTKHGDLYWALSGGGSGNYAVVLSVTVKTHQDGLVGGTYLTFNSSGIGSDVFWQAVETFHALLPSLVDAGAAALYQITDGKFLLLSLTAPGLSQAEVIQLLLPFIVWLDEHKASYIYVPTEFPSFYDHFAAAFGPLPYGPIPVSDIISSRLIPRSVIAERPTEATRTFRSIVEGQPYYIGIEALNANKTAKDAPNNAVLPAWRSTLMQFIVGSPWDWSIPREQMLLRNQKLVKEIIPSLVSLTPDSGTYINEGNVEQLNWQREYFGKNYHRLLEVKNHYDHDGLFYAAAGVGSERWIVDEDGRLCHNVDHSPKRVSRRYDEL